MTLHVERGGDGGPLVVLLHGLGATAEVWRPLTAVLPGRWMAPDLPGHGRSAPLEGGYSFGSLAAALAPAIGADEPVVVLGHSLGGVVGLALASGWFGVRVTGVLGLGIKLRWSADDLAKAAALAAKPNRAFDTEAAATDRALAVAGLTGLVTEFPGGVTEVDGGWSLALDPRAFGVGAPDVDGLLAAARADVLLAAGEHDPMCPAEHLLAADPDGAVLPGLGHNAHVEGPERVATVLAHFGGNDRA